MENERKEVKYVYRPAPCPDYDIECMESWLSEMAERGLFLSDGGFFAGIAAFERGEPRPAKYRLEAILNTKEHAPDPDKLELMEKYSWHYVDKRGGFYIYRSFDPEARELDTDPEVKAIAVNYIRKRQIASMISLVIWAVLYPSIIFFNSGLVTAALSLRTWFFLLISAAVLLNIVLSAAGAVYLTRLRRKLLDGAPASSGRSWRSRSRRYYFVRILDAAMIAAIILCALRGWSVSVMNEDKIQLDEYTGELPFAGMRDFAGEGYTDYEMTMLGLSYGFNSVSEWSDWLAPRCIEYSEYARITRADGSILDGGLDIQYFETASETIARLLAGEFYRSDRRGDSFRLIGELSDADAELAVIYVDEYHFTTFLMRSGNKVLRASFHQSSEQAMAPEEWAGILADSIS